MKLFSKQTHKCLRISIKILSDVSSSSGRFVVAIFIVAGVNCGWILLGHARKPLTAAALIDRPRSLPGPSTPTSPHHETPPPTPSIKKWVKILPSQSLTNLPSVPPQFRNRKQKEMVSLYLSQSSALQGGKLVSTQNVIIAMIVKH